MRRGFALLEVLVALVVVSLLILTSSKILLELTHHRLNLTQTQLRQLEVQNALFILSNSIKSSPLLTHSSTSLTLYPLNLPLFYSPSFSPIPTQCRGSQIEFYPTEYIYSQLDDKVFRVLGERGGVLTLEGEVKCGLLFPLSSPITFSLSPQKDLLKNGEILLKNVKRFELVSSGDEVKILLCDCEMSVAKARLYE